MEVEDCRKFIVQSRKRISELDAERAARLWALDEAKARLSRLEAEQAAVPKVISELVRNLFLRQGGLQRPRDRERNWSVPFPLATLPKVPPSFCRRGRGNSVQELRSPFPPMHKTWKGGCQRTHGTPRCDRVWGQRVNVGVDGCDPARGSPVSQFAVHSGQHGCVRIVAHQCGWKGCRVGEATNAGPSQSDFATQMDGGSDDQEHVSGGLLDALDCPTRV